MKHLSILVLSLFISFLHGQDLVEKIWEINEELSPEKINEYLEANKDAERVFLKLSSHKTPNIDFSVLPSLRDLIIEGNRNELVTNEFISGLASCKSLERLKLSSILLEEELSFKGLDSLSYLIVYDLDKVETKKFIKALPTSSIEGLLMESAWVEKWDNYPLPSTIKFLVLEYMNLKEFELSPEGHPELVYILLPNNQFSEFPKSLLDFQNLQGIDLSENYIKEIPESVFQLKNLDRLDFSGNKLTSISPNIGQLHNLQVLDLHYNYLKSLPSEIGELKSLKELYIMNNNISSAVFLENLDSLKNLKVSNNPIQNWPTKLSKNLKKLDLSNTGLKGVPDYIKELDLLTELNINKNPTGKLPDWFFEWQKEREIGMSNISLDDPKSVEMYFKMNIDTRTDYYSNISECKYVDGKFHLFIGEEKQVFDELELNISSMSWGSTLSAKAKGKNYQYVFGKGDEFEGFVEIEDKDLGRYKLAKQKDTYDLISGISLLGQNLPKSANSIELLFPNEDGGADYLKFLDGDSLRIFKSEYSDWIVLPANSKAKGVMAKIEDGKREHLILLKNNAYYLEDLTYNNGELFTSEDKIINLSNIAIESLDSFYLVGSYYLDEENLGLYEEPVGPIMVTSNSGNYLFKDFKELMENKPDFSWLNFEDAISNPKSVIYLDILFEEGKSDLNYFNLSQFPNLLQLQIIDYNSEFKDSILDMSAYNKLSSLELSNVSFNQIILPENLERLKLVDHSFDLPFLKSLQAKHKNLIIEGVYSIERELDYDRDMYTININGKPQTNFGYFENIERIKSYDNLRYFIGEKDVRFCIGDLKEGVLVEENVDYVDYSSFLFALKDNKFKFWQFNPNEEKHSFDLGDSIRYHSQLYVGENVELVYEASYGIGYIFSGKNQFYILKTNYEGYNIDSLEFSEIGVKSIVREVELFNYRNAFVTNNGNLLVSLTNGKYNFLDPINRKLYFKESYKSITWEDYRNVFIAEKEDETFDLIDRDLSIFAKGVSLFSVDMPFIIENGELMYYDIYSDIKKQTVSTEKVVDISYEYNSDFERSIYDVLLENRRKRFYIENNELVYIDSVNIEVDAKNSEFLFDLDDSYYSMVHRFYKNGLFRKNVSPDTKYIWNYLGLPILEKFEEGNSAVVRSNYDLNRDEIYTTEGELLFYTKHYSFKESKSGYKLYQDTLTTTYHFVGPDNKEIATKDIVKARFIGDDCILCFKGKPVNKTIKEKTKVYNSDCQYVGDFDLEYIKSLYQGSYYIIFKDGREIELSYEWLD